MQLESTWSRPLPQRIVLPAIATLRTLADVHVLIENLPEHHRDSPTWRLALMLEGLEHQTP
jgi:hypothetical protein